MIFLDNKKIRLQREINHLNETVNKGIVFITGGIQTWNRDQCPQDALQCPDSDDKHGLSFFAKRGPVRSL